MNDNHIDGTSGRGNDEKVFISYSRGDLKTALRLYQDLKNAGVVPWIDEEDLLPGQNWRLAINKAIRDSRYLIALLSDESVRKRGYVQKELRNALDVLDELPPDDVFVIPVRLDECETSFEKLASLHWVDLFPSYENGLNKLLKTFGCETPQSSKKAQDGPHFQSKTSVDYSAKAENTSSVSQPEIIHKNITSTHIIHLSDLHFGTSEKAPLWADQLVQDITSELKCPEIDALIISGDIANFSVPEEYKAAQSFLEQICTHLKIDSDQLVIVPGNHDLNWEASEDAYTLHKRSKYDGDLIEGCFIEESPKVVSVRDEEDYKERFLNFSRFHKTVTGRDYPLEYARQSLLVEIPGKKILIAGFNSAWELDYHFKDRAAIHADAVTHAVSAVRDRRFDGYLKISVWHHALNSPFEDRIKNHDFLERLVQAGFCVGLHGHIHESKNDLFRYEMGPEGRKMHIVGAGTFGAPVKEWVSGVPLQYNLLKIEGQTLTVETRQRRKLEGAWKAAAIWEQGLGLDPLPRYFLELPEIEVQSVEKSRDVDDDPLEIDASAHIPLEIPAFYTKWLKKRCRKMDIDQFRSRGRIIHVDLPEVFIPLFAQPPGEKNKRDEEPEMRGAEKAVDVETLIERYPSMLIEGQAGSGKTTLLKHYCHSIVSDEADDRLPVLIFLKDLQTLAYEFNGLPGAAATAEKMFERYFDHAGCGLDLPLVKAFCEAGKAVILIDGLDEADARLRDLTAKSVSDFQDQFENVRAVLTGRPHGMTGEAVDLFGEHHIRIQNLEAGQVSEFVHKWFCAVVEKGDSACTRTADDLLAEMRDHEDVDELKDTPLMLTAICMLYFDGGRLPGQRAELYAKFIEYLLHHRFPDEDDRVTVQRFLMALAMKMHMAETRTIDRIPAENLLAEILGKNGAMGRDALAKELDRIEAHCGLMKTENKRTLFWHLSFQAFLAARALVSGVVESHFEAIENYWGNEWFHEMIALYISDLAATGNVGIANAIVSKVISAADDESYVKWRLAARSMSDIHKGWRDSAVGKLAVDRMFKVMASEAVPKVRAEAGEILGRLGDPRKLKEFISIEAGLYKLSTGEVKIEPFEIGKYPVTNSWYKEFIEAGGYTKTEFWTPEGKKWLEYTKEKAPRFWYDTTWNRPNQPVVGVCWWEAMAFIAWLNQVDGDHKYFLPDENQWEAAAAGKNGREYPWGDWKENHCNSREAKIEKSSAVGTFSNGDTPEGVSDLAGNVWEWSRTEYYKRNEAGDFPFDHEIQELYEKGKFEEYYKKYREKYKINPMLRGGSWDFTSDNVRCAFRNRDDPYGRNNKIGFRCARA